MNGGNAKKLTQHVLVCCYLRVKKMACFGRYLYTSYTQLTTTPFLRPSHAADQSWVLGKNIWLDSSVTGQEVMHDNQRQRRATIGPFRIPTFQRFAENQHMNPLWSRVIYWVKDARQKQCKCYSTLSAPSLKMTWVQVAHETCSRVISNKGV